MATDIHICSESGQKIAERYLGSNPASDQHYATVQTGSKNALLIQNATKLCQDLPVSMRTNYRCRHGALKFWTLAEE